MGMGVKHYKKDGKEHKGGLHKMADGTLHSGKNHSKTSVRLFHYGDLSKKAKEKAKSGWGKIMATSNTTAFDMDFTEIAEEAWERAGREMRSGYDLRTARRSMNLMTIEWQNRGINMWTIEEGSIDLVKGQTQYTLPADTIDLLEHQLRTDAGSVSTQSDLNLSRISVSTYATIPNKLTQGRPIQIFIERLRDAPKINVWPVPDKAGYKINYYRLRRVQDAGAGVETADMNFRFLPCLVAGLAYYIAMKVPELTDRVSMLKSMYEEQFDLAAQEDREKAPVRFVPRIGHM